MKRCIMIFVATPGVMVNKAKTSPRSSGSLIRGVQPVEASFAYGWYNSPSALRVVYF